jgi:hypothetical protein
VLICAGAVASAVGADVAGYFDLFACFIVDGLQRVEEKGVFDIALGTLCDFASAMGRAISESPFFEQCLTVLLQHLRSGEVGFNAKAATVHAVGELVLTTHGGAGCIVYATTFLKIDVKVRTLVTTDEKDAEGDAAEVWSALIEMCSMFVHVCFGNCQTMVRIIQDWIRDKRSCM